MSDTNETRRIGKLMLYIGWIIVLAGLAAFFSNWEKNQYNPNRKVEGSIDGAKRTVQLQRNRHGHYLTNGKVNTKPVTFMLDTGATNVAVPANLAADLGLKRGSPHRVMTANGVAKAYHTEISQLEIGTIVLRDVRASITPGMLGEEILLGMSALKQLDFSQNGKTLTLTQRLN